MSFYILNFFRNDYYGYLDYIVYTLLTLIPLLIIVAFFTLIERKVMASIQRRKGPSVVGIFGFLQPFADGLKLVIKEIIFPNKANKFLFVFAPSITLFLSFIGWSSISLDLNTQILNLNNSLLYVLVVSSLGVYGILLAGWASNSKYALMGSLRSVSQMISYEVSISLVIIPIILFSGSLNLNKIIYTQIKTIWFFFPLLPLAIIFFISILAETNRAPFDLPEAEAELVAGYNVEYSGIAFAAFFLGEYANILLMSSLFVIFFFGGMDTGINFFLFTGSFFNILFQEFFFFTKIMLITFLFVFIRANLPRFRFDQLMFIGWKIFLPITLSFIFFYSGILLIFNSLQLVEIPRISSNYNYITIFQIRF
jgi:NADH-quinone oxidoreductase subunit H